MWKRNEFLWIIAILVFGCGPRIFAQEAKLYVEAGHSEGVNSVDLSPDGKLLASGSNDGTITLWDISSGVEITTLRSRNESKKYKKLVNKIRFSPNGNVLASGTSLGFEGFVELWDIATGGLIKTFKGEGHSITSLDFAPDGKVLASGAYVNSNEGPTHLLDLWNVDSGELVRTLTGVRGTIDSIAFSSDGLLAFSECNYAANSSPSCTIGIWETKTGKRLRNVYQGTGRVASVGFAGQAVFALVDRKFYSWDIGSGKILRSVLIPGKEGDSYGDLSRGGEILARVVGETFVLFDTKTGKKQKSFLGTVDTVVVESSFSPTGKTLATYYPVRETPVQIWDVASGRLIQNLTSRVSDYRLITFSPNGKEIAVCGGWSGSVKLWNLDPGESKAGIFVKDLVRKAKDLELDLPSTTLYNGAKQAIAFNSAGSILATYNFPKQTIEVWNSATATLIDSFSLGDRDLVRKVSEFVPGYFSSSEDKTVSTYANLRAELVDDTNIVLSDKQSGNELASLISVNETDWVVMAPDGRFDTNQSLDSTRGLHWIVGGEFWNPLPLEIFMRQYYEPNLLPRILQCNREGNCDKEFKPLPTIGTINRVQPNVRSTTRSASQN